MTSSVLFFIERDEKMVSSKIRFLHSSERNNLLHKNWLEIFLQAMTSQLEKLITITIYYVELLFSKVDWIY
jgi:hypothetical protein